MKKSATKEVSPQSQSLFNSIQEQEKQQINEHFAQCFAQRFGLLYKIIDNRRLSFRDSFIDECDNIIRKYSNLIDDELRSTNQDTE